MITSRVRKDRKQLKYTALFRVFHKNLCERSVKPNYHKKPKKADLFERGIK